MIKHYKKFFLIIISFFVCTSDTLLASSYTQTLSIAEREPVNAALLMPKKELKEIVLLPKNREPLVFFRGILQEFLQEEEVYDDIARLICAYLPNELFFRFLQKKKPIAVHVEGYSVRPFCLREALLH